MADNAKLNAESAAAQSSALPPPLRWISYLSTACGIASSLMMLAAVFITCQMIFVRYVLNYSTIWQTETVVYLMVAATLVGLPHVQQQRGHVNVDLLPNMLPAKLRRLLLMLTLVLTLSVIGVMLFYAVEMWHMAWSRGWTSDTVWGVRQWIPYLAMPLGFGVYMLQLLADLYAQWAMLDEPQLPAPQEPN